MWILQSKSVADRHCCNAVKRDAEPACRTRTEIDTITFAGVCDWHREHATAMSHCDPRTTRQPWMCRADPPVPISITASGKAAVIPLIVYSSGDRAAMDRCRELLQQCGEYDESSFHCDGEV